MKKNSLLLGSVSAANTSTQGLAGRHPQKAGIGASWGIFGTLLGLIVIAILLLVFRNEVILSYPVCRSGPCRHFAQLLMQTLDDSADPCKDFYHYVCSGWQTRHPESHSVVTVLQEEAILSIGRETLASTLPKANQTAVQKAARFYQSCIHATATENIDKEVSSARVMLKSMHLPWPAIDDTAQPLAVLLQLASNWSLPLWFSVEVGPGDYPEVFFRSGSIINTPPWMRWVVALSQVNRSRELVATLFHLFSDSNDTSVKFTDAFMNKLKRTDENVLNALKSAAARGEEPTSYENLVEFADRVDETNLTGEVWANLLKSNVYYKVSISSPVKVSQLSVLRASCSLLSQISRDELLLHMGWLVAVTMGQLLLPNITVAFDSESRSSEAESTGHTKCFFLAEHQWLFAWSIPFLSILLTPRKMKEVNSIARAVERAIIFSIERARWLDVVSKQNAISLLDGLQVYWGLPEDDRWNIAYRDAPDMGDSLAENWASLARVRGIIKHAVRQANYTYVPFMSRGSWSRDRRRLILPPSYLLPPLFYENATLGINMAPMGARISRLLMGAFAVSDRRGFAPASEEAAFEHVLRLQCFKRQLQDAEVAGTPQDIAGVLRAVPLVRAYQMMNNTESTRGRLEGLEWFTDDQMLFMSMCYAACGSPGDPGPEASCNVALRNTPEFARIFHCSSGTPMNPRNQCQIF